MLWGIFSYTCSSHISRNVSCWYLCATQRLIFSWNVWWFFSFSFWHIWTTKIATQKLSHVGLSLFRAIRVSEIPGVEFIFIHAVDWSFIVFFLSERKSALFLLVQRDASLVGHVMSTTALDNDVACSLYCTRDRNCQSFNYYREQGICELNKEKTPNNIKGVLVPYRGVEYYEKMELNQWSIKIYFGIFHADVKRMIKSGRHIPDHLWKNLMRNPVMLKQNKSRYFLRTESRFGHESCPRRQRA